VASGDAGADDHIGDLQPALAGRAAASIIGPVTRPRVRAADGPASCTFSNIARKGAGRPAAAEGARPGPLPGPRRDRREGHDVEVPGLAASRTRPLEFGPLERLMASSGLRPALPCPRYLAREAARDGRRAEQARREPTA